jgi:hypothetical protein
MKRVLLISCVVLALPASAALAGGLNLNWGPECASDVLVMRKDFTCDTNSGSSVMVGSFVPTASHERLVAVDAVIDGRMCSGPVIPDWWQFKNPGACRQTALSANLTYSDNAVVCQDAWANQGISWITYYGEPGAATYPTGPVQGIRARIKVSCSVPTDNASAVEGGIEYLAFNLVVNHTKTVGSESCTGCLVPSVWALTCILPTYLDSGVVNDETIVIPIINGLIMWQTSVDCIPDAALNKTWGQVKSLYR